MKVGVTMSVILETKISLETAAMIEDLRNYYEKNMDMSLSKSDVFIKAFNNLLDREDSIDWEYINNKKIKVGKYDLTSTSLRPKLNITSEIKEKLNEFKELIPKELKIRNVTMGVCIKLILKSELLEIQSDQDKKINAISDIIKNNKLKYMTESYSKEVQLYIEEFSNDILLELEKYELDRP